MVVPATLLLTATLSAGCGARTPAPDGTSKAIAFFLPESKTTRYEALDRPLFEAKVKSLCADCRLMYYNADQDAAKQQQQIEAALTQGADVLVIDAVDAKTVAPLINQAKQRQVPVIAYDRLISGIEYEYYVSFNNVRVGELQGLALLEAMKVAGTLGKGKVVFINGAPTDPSSADYKNGAHKVLDGMVAVGREFDTPDWSPDKAQQQMEQAITALGRQNITGVLSANDGMASGAIAAMKRAGFTALPPITGQDAELSAIQRILTGEQYMTIFLDVRAEAEKAAELAVGLTRGDGAGAVSRVNNGTTEVPAVLLDPIVVTAAQVKDTIIESGFYRSSDVCTGEVAVACAKHGIS